MGEYKELSADLKSKYDKLRQYDISSVVYHFEDFLKAWEKYKFRECKCIGFDFSYTNINFDSQEFYEKITLNLEGVDLRYKDFTGVEE